MHFWDEHKTITRYYEMKVSGVCEKYRLRQLEYDIIMFIYNNPEYNTAADIVAVRKSTKSHVSISLKSLESKGLISRKQDESNKKRIEIFLTPTAEPIIAEGLQTQKQFAEDVLQGLSEEERAACIRAFRKIHHNADECLKQHKGAKL